MPSLRRVAPFFSIFWVAAVVCHLSYFRFKSSFDRLPDCLRDSCGGEASDAPLVTANIRGSQSQQEEQAQGKEQQSSEPEPVHLVYASDDESLFAVEASIRSAMRHASEFIAIHFVGDTPLSSNFSNVHFYNLTEVDKKYKLKEFTNPKRRGVTMLAGLNSNLANFVRFVIPDLLPQAHKAMWVDSDTIFECDVVPMVRKALTTTSFAIAAVPVEGPPHGVLRKIKRKYLKKYKAYTFNAGVYVVNLDRWRSQGWTEKIRKVALKNRKKRFYNYGSQPPLVLAVGDRFEHLSPAWNVKVNKLNLGLLKEKACLLHWSGKRKPWNTFNDPDIHNYLWTPYATTNGTKT